MRPFARLLTNFLLAMACTGISIPVQADPNPIGIVIMHGKGGAPTLHVADLAGALAEKGYLVANLEMPWSGRRNYDADTTRAEEEVEAALAAIRAKGAQKVFVAGHSQGGLFALHFAGKHSVDGIIAITPGGSVNSPVFRDKLGESVARARQLVAEGKGQEKVRFLDFEAGRGTYPVITTPAAYLAWFDPEGAMNAIRAARAANPQIPILWMVAKNDYPQLRKTMIPMFNNLPAHPLNKLYETDSDHLGAPSASLHEILRWTGEVANAPRR